MKGFLLFLEGIMKFWKPASRRTSGEWLRPEKLNPKKGRKNLQMTWAAPQKAIQARELVVHLELSMKVDMWTEEMDENLQKKWLDLQISSLIQAN